MQNLRLILLAAILLLPSSFVSASVITVQSTTSTENSGLFEYLLPLFAGQTGIKVRVVAVGTGQAIKNASRCDGDILLVHAKFAEQEFVEWGFGVERFDLMYNDFVLIGPKSDPAGIKTANTIYEALEKIAASNTKFISRADDSGTHKAEMRLWQSTNVSPVKDSGKWYLETGRGMGAAINMAVGIGAYIMSDRATWISFGNKRESDVLYDGDEALFNQYGVVLVNPEKCTQSNNRDALIFQNWLLSKKGQSAIAAFKISGQQLFFPNAK